MRIQDRVRAVWADITRSPKRTGVAAGVVVGALLVGIGFSLAVNAARDRDQVGGAPSASATAKSVASPTPTATPSETPAPTPTATATATPTVPPTPEPIPSASAAIAPTPAPPVRTGECDGLTIDADGTPLVNGERVDDLSAPEYGEQMPMAVLRLAARAAAVPDAMSCLQVDVANVVVSGNIEICGEVTVQRLEPLPTPSTEPPSMPFNYGRPTIAGVPISDRMMDVNSYPLFDIADVADVPLCWHVAASSNDVHITLSLAICESVRLGQDRVFTVVIGDDAWRFAPEYVYDDAGALPIGETVVTGIDFRNYKNDVNHSIEMAVWAQSGCPWPGR